MICRLCGNDNTKVLTSTLRRGEGTVYYCDKCRYGMLQPSFSNSKDYYNVEYRKKFKDVLDISEETPEQIYNMRRDYQDDRIRIISNYFNSTKTFLEIGCSAGQFLTHIKNRFAKITGIELSETCAKYTRELLECEVFTSDIHELIQSEWSDELSNVKFDYVGFFQVLEHIGDPVNFLNDVRTVLNEDGKIFVEVPNLDDPLRVLWDVPEYERFYYHEAHLNYFSEDSLRKALDLAGFEVENIYFLQDYNLLNAIYWFFNHAPQKSCDFGLSKPRIDFKDMEVGEKINNLLERTNDEYIRIIQNAGMTSNIFAVARKKS